MVFVQKWPFFQLFFLGNIGQKKVFYDILVQKTPFYNIKTRTSDSRKIKIFFKGFCPKMAIRPNFVLGNIGHENIFYDITEQKIAFLGYKNNKFKKSKN